jgi:hypothetical protein
MPSPGSVPKKAGVRPYVASATWYGALGSSLVRIKGRANWHFESIAHTTPGPGGSMYVMRACMLGAPVRYARLFACAPASCVSTFVWFGYAMWLATLTLDDVIR